MEVDGKEFMRNVALNQEQEKLKREQEKLEALKRESVYKDEPKPQDDGSAYADFALNNSVNSNFQQQDVTNEAIRDIKLNMQDPNANKKKYILLGLALILVFVITILVIRVVSNSDTEESLQAEAPQQELITDKILDKIDSNEEFQKAIEKKDAQKEVQALEEQREQEQPTIELPPAIEKLDTPLLVETPKKEEPTRDPLGLDSVPDVKEPLREKTTVAPAPIQDPKPIAKEKVVETKNTIKDNEVKVEKKITGVPAVKPSQIPPSTSKVSGYYIQVGAFTKAPSRALLNQITSNGYSYAIHPVNVKGIMYNKVIIGPFPSRAVASNNLPGVKQKLKNSGAYIVKF